MNSIVVLLCVVTAALGQLTSDGCYREYKDSKVMCMLPFTSETVNTLEECGALCTQNAPRCKAAQMTPFPESSCQLFDAAVPATATGRRKRLAGCYGYGASLITSQGYCYMLPTGYGCSALTTTAVAQSEATTAAPPTPPTPPTAPSTVLTDAPTVPTVATVPTVVTVPTDAPTTTTQASASSTVSGSPVPPEATCPDGKVVRYTFVEGYELSGTPDFTFKAANEQECMTACTNNKLPDGKQAPCRSADFNAKTQQCSISLQVTPPAGPTKAQKNPDSKHFEKVCVDAAVAQRCPGAYFRSPQHILIGFAQAVTTASSTVDCLEQCANSQARFNFLCSSGVYYFDESLNNCILNSETRATAGAELFIPEETDGVEYFEPACTPARHRRQASKKRNRNILRLKSDTFSGWTMCDTVELNHMRFKQCETLNPNKCQIDFNGCDPAKETEYDLDVNATAPIGQTQLDKKKTTRRGKPTSQKPGSATTPKAGSGSSAPPKVGSSTPPPKAGSSTPPPKPGSSTPPKSGTTPKAATSQTSPPVLASSPKPGASDCAPIITSDGRKDCNNGVRILPNGKRQPCNPSKKDCDEAKDKGNGKQKDSKGPRRT